MFRVVRNVYLMLGFCGTFTRDEEALFTLKTKIRGDINFASLTK